MTYDSLLKHMEEEAERTIRELRESAEREIAAIQKEAQDKIDATRAEVHAEAAEEADREKARLAHKASLEARKKSGMVKGELVARALDAAKLQLQSLRSSNDYRHVFSRLAEEAAQEMKSAPHAIVAPGDEDLCSEALNRHGCRPEVHAAPELWGGLILTTADGKERIVNTLNSRYEKSRETLLRILAEELFADGKNGS